MSASLLDEAQQHKLDLIEETHKYCSKSIKEWVKLFRYVEYTIERYPVTLFELLVRSFRNGVAIVPTA